MRLKRRTSHIIGRRGLVLSTRPSLALWTFTVSTRAAHKADLEHIYALSSEANNKGGSEMVDDLSVQLTSFQLI
jgi:hypothetical protein